MSFKDKFASYAKTITPFGYSVMAYPRQDIGLPLDVLARYGKRLIFQGTLGDILVPDGVEMPVVSQNNDAPSISGHRTDKHKKGCSINILAGVIRALGGSSVGLDVSYTSAKAIQFEMEDVKEDRIKPVELDSFLTKADMRPDLGHVLVKLLDADRIYVVTSTLKSDKISVSASSATGSAVKINVSEQNEIVGAKVTVSGESEVSVQLTYKGQYRLPFAIQAVRLFYENGQFSIFTPMKPGVVLALAASEAGLPGPSQPMDEIEPLLTDGLLGSIEDKTPTPA